MTNHPNRSRSETLTGDQIKAHVASLGCDLEADCAAHGHHKGTVSVFPRPSASPILQIPVGTTEQWGGEYKITRERLSAAISETMADIDRGYFDAPTA